MKDKFLKRMLFTEKQIVEKCKELGKWIDSNYQKSPNLLLVGLLKGSVPFMAELIKHVTVNHEIDFMIVSSYEGTTKSNGNLKVIMDLSGDIEGKDVLIIEDIVDTGNTLSRITKRFKTLKANSVKTIALLDKKNSRTVSFEPDMYGFRIENEFVYGFGLDVKEKLRNLPYIAVFDLDKIDEL